MQSRLLPSLRLEPEFSQESGASDGMGSDENSRDGFPGPVEFQERLTYQSQRQYIGRLNEGNLAKYSERHQGNYEVHEMAPDLLDMSSLITLLRLSFTALHCACARF